MSEPVTTREMREALRHLIDRAEVGWNGIDAGADLKIVRNSELPPNALEVSVTRNPSMNRRSETFRITIEPA